MLHRLPKMPGSLRAWGIVEVLTVFTLTRLLFALLGVRFDASGLDHYWQFLPTPLLRDHLLQSLWHLHAQPPLFNAFLGVGLQLFADPTPFFHATFLALSLTMHFALFRLLLVLAVPRRWAMLALVAWSLNPSLATHENWLFYALWEAGFLLLAAWAIAQKRLWLWAIAVTVLMLARAAFHPMWLMLVLVMYGFSRWRKRQPVDRRVLRWALLPVLLATLWMAKNQAQVGDFSMSSWLGMNLARVTVNALPEQILEPLIARKELSPFARVGPFRPLADYRLPQAEPTGIPALDGDNFNNLQYVAISHALRHDSLFVATHFPDVYLGRVVGSSSIFLETTNHNAQLHDNREHLAWLENAYNLLLHRVDILMLLFVLFALTVGAHALAARTPVTPLARDDLLAAFLTGTVLWVLLAGTFLEYGENNRFRFGIDPLLYLLLVQAVFHLRQPIDAAARD
jgi:hypothetical protein